MDLDNLVDIIIHYLLIREMTCCRPQNLSQFYFYINFELNFINKFQTRLHLILFTYPPPLNLNFCYFVFYILYFVFCILFYIIYIYYYYYFHFILFFLHFFSFHLFYFLSYLPSLSHFLPQLLHLLSLLLIPLFIPPRQKTYHPFLYFLFSLFQFSFSFSFCFSHFGG